MDEQGFFASLGEMGRAAAYLARSSTHAGNDYVE
jgi:hypothetical protein